MANLLFQAIEIKENEGAKVDFKLDLKQLMFGFGDGPKPLEESQEVMDCIINEYISEMTNQAKELVSRVKDNEQNKTGFDFDDALLEIFKKEPKWKKSRILDLLHNNEELREQKMMIETEIREELKDELKDKSSYFNVIL